MQDYTPIAGFSLTLAGQRVSMHKCGSDPPNAGHLAPMILLASNMSYFKYSAITTTILKILLIGFQIIVSDPVRSVP